MRATKPVANLYGLTEDSIARRQKYRAQFSAGVWVVLSAVTFLAFFFFVPDGLPKAILLFLSILKYLPVLGAIYAASKLKAARYLTDIYELQDEAIASGFIEDLAFGNGYKQKITIKDGRISPEDEQSPIILIGGPGYVQVNLDNVVLLERVDGTPEIIYPRGDAWKLGSFERIREIGKSDEPGKREYAIINLRDQFVRGLSVKSRTKDGIPIEAQDIKALFSIQRKPKDQEPGNAPYHFAETAVYSLVYNQTIITPAPPKNAVVTFPWESAVIPLINSELENLITSHNLSEILASISIREIDQLSDLEATNTQMRVEMTGELTAAGKNTAPNAPPFESRTKITSLFFSDSFVEKAKKLGVAIHWIDIGTWKLPNQIILEELKNGWKLMRENAARKRALEKSSKRFEMQAFIDLVEAVIVNSYTRANTSGSRKLSEKEYLELLKMLEDNPDITTNSKYQQLFSYNAAAKKDANTIALDILKAFRRELIAAKVLIEKENRAPIERQVELARIEKALRDIDHHIFPPKKQKGST
ncbi:MAG: hypothetical protein HXY38_08835 [Chloroflexi bacterium]|nr:hypothetical protein [Chloroflexota bacterium]